MKYSRYMWNLTTCFKYICKYSIFIYWLINLQFQQFGLRFFTPVHILNTIHRYNLKHKLILCTNLRNFKVISELPMLSFIFFYSSNHKTSHQKSICNEIVNVIRKQICFTWSSIESRSTMTLTCWYKQPSVVKKKLCSTYSIALYPWHIEIPPIILAGRFLSSPRYLVIKLPPRLKPTRINFVLG